MHTNEPQSFYFFDFDDNIMFLETTILIQNTVTSEVLPLSTAQFAQVSPFLGIPGKWQAYALFKDSYQHFRDHETQEESFFVSDIREAITQRAPEEWQAPSWDFFAHACAKQRPLSIITARGHKPETIKAGIRLLKEHGFIEQEPNYLTIFPVSNDDVRIRLGDTALHYTIPSLKKLSIIKSVEAGLDKYGHDLPHQFGMSDDDPRNVDLIIEAMRDCKQQYEDKRFFVFNTHLEQQVKLEVLPIGMP
jgi:hypothetical protein